MYLQAGSDIIETNTFGALDIVLRDYELEDKVFEINPQPSLYIKLLRNTNRKILMKKEIYM
nr:homocysteine S-methyltransferase family protein [Leptotrichia sp. OH3620_COT-345]